MYMVMLVLDDIKHLDKVLDAWVQLGVPGSTIIESSGLFRRQSASIPMRYRYGEDLSLEKDNITLLSIVQKEENIQKCLDAVEQIVGDLNNPNTGVFCAWPLYVTKGIKNLDQKEADA
jgi:nitrogen regulatory protein PII